MQHDVIAQSEIVQTYQFVLKSFFRRIVNVHPEGLVAVILRNISCLPTKPKLPTSSHVVDHPFCFLRPIPYEVH